MKAIVLAGGKGTRLYPYSALLPKPLMPLGDMPVLELLLRQLRNAGIEEVFLAVNHLRHLIEAFFGDGSRFGIKINYSIENMPLGTAGPIASVIDRLGEDFLVTNGDLLTTLNIADMIRFHYETKAAGTLGAYPREVKIDFGVVDLDDEMRMVGYREKPSYQYLVSMGIYVLNRASVHQFLHQDTFLDMPVLVSQIRDSGGDIRA
ncbi:MAG TPA: sugar phosphate nucleotidyltransferase, partial [Acidiphilium sp.]|nr:sugar phosphate nucleotidyltransferase [Acidiphilium sp.]